MNGIYLVIKTGAQAIDGCQARAFRELHDARTFMKSEVRHLMLSLAGANDPGKIELVTGDFENSLLQNGEETRWIVREVILPEDNKLSGTPGITRADLEKAAAMLKAVEELLNGIGGEGHV